MHNKLIVLSLVLAGSTLGFASGITTASGTFNQDDDVATIAFNLSAGNSLVTIQSTSFATGGFEPVLTLFDPLGNLFLVDSTGGTTPGGCGGRSIDPVSGYCLDGLIQAVLGPGAWTLVLTEWENLANGPTLLDGFSQDGTGNFTGPLYAIPSDPNASFILFDGSQRTADWSVTIDGVDVPEPSTFMLMGCGLLGLARLRRKSPTILR